MAKLIHKDEELDGRDPRDGGYSWTQHELYRVLVPIVGWKGAYLYNVMAYMIPERERNPHYDLSVRKIAEVSGLGKTLVAEQLNVLVRVGMLERISQGEDRPALFLMGDLRSLAALGKEELASRYAVRQADSSGDGGGSNSSSGTGAEKPNVGAGRANGEIDGKSPVAQDAAAPEPSVDDAVRVADSQPGNPSLHEIGGKAAAETTLAALMLSAKRGVAVREKGGSCPPGGSPLIHELNLNETNTPQPPDGGPGISDLNLADLHGNDKKQKLPSEGANAVPVQDAKALAAAVAKVMRDCGLSEPRMAAVIERAMRTAAAARDEAPDWNRWAEAMAEAQQCYSRYGRNGLIRTRPVRMRAFIADGIWRDEGLWDLDHERLRRL